MYSRYFSIEYSRPTICKILSLLLFFLPSKKLFILRLSIMEAFDCLALLKRAAVNTILNSFCDKNCSTGSIESAIINNNSSNKLVYVNVVNSSQEILQDLFGGNLPLISDQDYEAMCNKITTPFNYDRGEVKFYLPRIAEMIAAVFPNGRNRTFRGKNVVGLEQQIPSKCFSIPDFCFGMSLRAADIYLHFGIKQIDDLVEGIMQSCAYTLLTLIDRIELMRRDDIEYVAYCVASDGKHLAVAKVSVDFRKKIGKNVSISHSAEWCDLSIDPLVGPDGRQADGIRVLHGLLSLDPAKLGHLEGGTLVDGHILNAVLGKGGFSTVYAATPPVGEGQVVLKMCHFLPTVATDLETVNEPVMKELSVLQQLQAGACEHIPQLSPLQCAPDATFKWVSTLHVNLTLTEYLRGDNDMVNTAAARSLFAKGYLSQGLRAAVNHAHSKNIGHCDLQPENVTVNNRNPAVPIVVLIDWGLAGYLGDERHRESGSMEFYHDEIYTTDIYNTQHIIKPEHDIVAVDYVAVSVIRFDVKNSVFLAVPWKRKNTTLLQRVLLRAQYVQYYLAGQGDAPAEQEQEEEEVAGPT